MREWRDCCAIMMKVHELLEKVTFNKSTRIIEDSSMEDLDKGIFGALALFLVFVDYIPYVASILKGKTKPHLYSWIIWATLGILAFAMQASSGLNPGLWATAASAAFGVFIIGHCLLKSKNQSATLSDKVCLAVALLAIPVWLLEKNAVIAMSLVSGIGLLAAWPTLRKSIKAPKEEALFPWTISAVWPVISLFAVSEFTLVTQIYFTGQILANWSIFLTLLWGRISWRDKVLLQAASYR